jgi:hypothetical protein
MVIKTALIFMVILVLMEDSASIKKSEDEEREDRELAERVNATLAEEKKKEDEEKRREDEKKKKKEEEDETKTKVQDEDKRNRTKQEDQDEASPTCNCTCPTLKPCRRCPEERECPPCERCPEEQDCPPCQPCPADNSTLRGQELPLPPSCPELPSMTVPVALATGAIVSLLAVSAAAVLGLVLRYVPPLISGFLFLVLILMVWFLSSRYPEVAREMGARAWTMMQEATTALSHRIMEALQRHNEQVIFSV